MRLRSVLAAAAAWTALAAPSAFAAPFSYTDLSGDAPQPSLDIVGVTYSTTRSALVVRMDLAGPAAPATGVVYTASAWVQYCGEATLTYAPRSAWDAAVAGGSFSVDCHTYPPALAGRTGYALPVAVTTSGNSVTWTVPLEKLKYVARRGDRFSEFVASVEPSDPVFGVVRAGAAAEHLVGAYPFDVARSEATWRMG